MKPENLTTTVTEFVLLGLTQNPVLKRCIFVFVSIVYLTTWLGNFTVIITVIMEQQLHRPMYFLLANLAFMDVSDATVNAPKMLSSLLLQKDTIPFNECIAQIFFFHFISGALIFLLVVMAIDRYVAIQKPLRYLIIMNRGTCIGLVFGAWLGGFVHSIAQVFLIFPLPFCGPKVLDNFFCDVAQVINLACMDTHMVEWLVISNSGVVVILIFVVLLISYSIILFKIRTRVTQGKGKALSTCGAQITVVCLLFIPYIYIYARPFKKRALDKIVSVIFTLFVPMLNPIIYTLRNAEMKRAVRKMISKILSSRKILMA